ncbi:MAG: hypothetical protein R3201_00060, partial [Oceanisphaera sp.]|nr:hypothetical protein [Oceanisphaera sp.]
KMIEALKSLSEKHGRTAGHILLVLVVLNFAFLAWLDHGANSYIAAVEKCEAEKLCRCGLVDGYGSDKVDCIDGASS